MKNPIKLGERVRDVVTGLEGVVVSRIEYLTGCEQCGISAPAKDGKVPNAEYIDYTRLEVIGTPIALAHTDAAAARGGPNRDAPR